MLVIAAEKEPPFGVAVYAVEGEALQGGVAAGGGPGRDVRAVRGGGVWPCYGDDAQPLTLPAWAWKRL